MMACGLPGSLPGGSLVGVCAVAVRVDCAAACFGSLFGDFLVYSHSSLVAVSLESCLGLLVGQIHLASVGLSVSLSWV